MLEKGGKTVAKLTFDDVYTVQWGCYSWGKYREDIRSPELTTENQYGDKCSIFIFMGTRIRRTAGHSRLFFLLIKIINEIKGKWE